MPEKSDNNSVETPKKKPHTGFVKGQPGGPGRGHKKPDAVIDSDLLDAIEKVVRSGLGKGDLADRLRAAGLGLKLKGMKEQKVEPITTPFVLKLVGLLTDLAGRCSEGAGEPQNGLSVIDLMVRVCPTCTLICKAKDDSEIF